MSEFVIWGKAPNGLHEILLVSEHAGLRDMAHAKKTMALLASEHGCTDMRVHRLAPLSDASEVLRLFVGSVGQ
jgi:hypothetical protein